MIRGVHAHHARPRTISKVRHLDQRLLDDLVFVQQILDEHAEQQRSEFHETMHIWVPNLADDTDADAWYHEGQAEYFSTVLAFQAGLFGPRDYLDKVNEEAAGYYGGP